MAVTIDGGRKVPTIYIHDQYYRNTDQKNNAFKVVIDIGFRPFI